MEYNIFFPINNGELNINGLIGGSLTGVLADLQTIWTHCINKLLDIKTSEFPVSAKTAYIETIIVYF